MSIPVARAGADLRLLRAAVFAAVCVVVSAAGHVLASRAGVPLWTLAAGFLAVLAAVAPLAGRERTLPGISAGLAVAQLALHALFGLGQHTVAAQATHPGKPSSQSLIDLAARLVCGGDGDPARLTADKAQSIVAASGIATPDQPAPTAGTPVLDAHAHGALDAATAASAPSLAHTLLPSLPMLLGHLLAALVLGLLLRHGEAALFRLVRLSARDVAEGFAEEALVRALRAALMLVRALRTGLPGAPTTPPRTPRAHGRGKAGPRSLVLEHSVSRRGPPHYELVA